MKNEKLSMYPCLPNINVAGLNQVVFLIKQNFDTSFYYTGMGYIEQVKKQPELMFPLDFKQFEHIQSLYLNSRVTFAKTETVKSKINQNLWVFVNVGKKVFVN